VNSAGLDPQTKSPGLERRMVLTLAAGAGISAANLYYAQPLLHTIAEKFDASVGSAGLIVTGSQIGYAIGSALLVPSSTSEYRACRCSTNRRSTNSSPAAYAPK